MRGWCVHVCMCMVQHVCMCMVQRVCMCVWGVGYNVHTCYAGIKARKSITASQVITNVSLSVTISITVSD